MTAVHAITAINANTMFLVISALTISSGTHIRSRFPHIVLKRSPVLKLTSSSKSVKCLFAGKNSSGFLKLLNLNAIWETITSVIGSPHSDAWSNLKYRLYLPPTWQFRNWYKNVRHWSSLKLFMSVKFVFLSVHFGIKRFC